MIVSARPWRRQKAAGGTEGWESTAIVLQRNEEDAGDDRSSMGDRRTRKMFSQKNVLQEAQEWTRCPSPVLRVKKCIQGKKCFVNKRELGELFVRCRVAGQSKAVCSLWMYKHCDARVASRAQGVSVLFSNVAVVVVDLDGTPSRIRSGCTVVAHHQRLPTGLYSEYNPSRFVQ